MVSTQPFHHADSAPLPRTPDGGVDGGRGPEAWLAMVGWEVGTAGRSRTLSRFIKGKIGSSVKVDFDLKTLDVSNIERTVAGGHGPTASLATSIRQYTLCTTRTRKLAIQ